MGGCRARGTSRGVLCVLLLALVLAACGREGVEFDDRGSPSAADVELLDSQPTLPAEPGYVYADVAADPDDLLVVWQRFQMSGSPPTVDFDETALLFLGLGESGACPVVFHDGTVQADRVEVRLGLIVDGHDVGPGEPWPEGTGCTDDYNPRTLVVAVGKPSLAEGGFVLDVIGDTAFRAALSGVPVDMPPPSPRSLWGFGEQIDARYVAQPESARVGETVEILLRNDSATVANLGDMPVLQYWDRQRWLPVDGQHDYEQHPAVLTVGQSVAPGESSTIFEVDTSGFAPGWYAVHSRVAGGGGGHEQRAAFRVDQDEETGAGSDQTADDSMPRSLPDPAQWPVALVEPPCHDEHDEDAECPAGFDVGEVSYAVGCGYVHPHLVSSQRLAEGRFEYQDVVVHLIEDVDPLVMVAVRMEADCHDAGNMRESWVYAIAGGAHRDHPEELQAAICEVLDTDEKQRSVDGCPRSEHP